MIIFITIFGVGFAILLLSLIFGHDADFDMDHGDFGHAGHGPNILSFRMLALLMVGFGAVGFGFRATSDWSMFRSSMAGVGGAAVVGIIGYLILRMFYASQASSTISDSDIIGSAGNVIDAIGETDYGQVACIIGGREFTFLARSKDGTIIRRNQAVRIVAKSGSVVTVTPSD